MRFSIPGGRQDRPAVYLHVDNEPRLNLTCGRAQLLTGEVRSERASQLDTTFRAPRIITFLPNPASLLLCCLFTPATRTPRLRKLAR